MYHFHTGVFRWDHNWDPNWDHNRDHSRDHNTSYIKRNCIISTQVFSDGFLPEKAGVKIHRKIPLNVFAVPFAVSIRV